MSELTFMATVGESRLLQLPPDAPLGEVKVVLREKHPRGSRAALWHTVDSTPKIDNPEFWQRAREELLRSREED